MFSGLCNTNLFVFRNLACPSSAYELRGLRNYFIFITNRKPCEDYRHCRPSSLRLLSPKLTSCVSKKNTNKCSLAVVHASSHTSFISRTIAYSRRVFALVFSGSRFANCCVFSNITADGELHSTAAECDIL